MFLPFALVIGIMVFAVQLILCFRAGKWMKRIPTLLLAAGVCVCWLVYVMASQIQLPDYTDFAAYIYARLLLLLLAADLLAWMVYGGWKKIRKKQ